MPSRLLIGATWPWLDQHPAQPELWQRLEQLQPDVVRIASNAAPEDIEQLHTRYPSIRVVVRCKFPKVGPDGNHYQTGDDRPGLVRYTEWPTEPTPFSICSRLLDLGHSVDLELLNEPDIEWDEAASTDPNRWQAAAQDCLAYLEREVDWIRDVLPSVRLVAPAFSEGWPERHGEWLEVFDGFIRQLRAAAVHAYTNADPFEDANWGGRPLAYRERFGPSVALLVTEVNDNGKMFEADPRERAQHLVEYVAWLRDQTAVESVCLFELPATPGGAGWWPITPEIAAAVGQLPRDRPQAAPGVGSEAPAPKPDPVATPAASGGFMFPDDVLSDLWKAIRDDVPLNPDTGIFKKWAEDPVGLGSPVGPERPAGDGNVYQAFARGVLRYVPGQGVDRAA